MKKIPLVLVPGLLCDEALWEYQISALDHISIGLITDRHMHYDSIGQIAESIVAAAPPRFALAGLSMGGYIALEIYRKYSERVDRLALLDTSARAESRKQTERRNNLMALSRQDKFNDVVELLWPLLVDSSRRDDKVLKHKIVSMAHRVGPKVFVRQQHAIIHRLDQLPHLPKIACPAIVVCGENDQITPVACSEEMTAYIHGAKKVILPGCGHMSTIEKPDKVTQILQEWLAPQS
ncbi:alpha/beta fold hydrolase [Desulfotignum phosphitoxidans]|uniref:Alpha/beta hydrolase fold protein n=1 Tax=Desulfotignum phosphitoxidans DSM 13687 TaxID=1286635 RepID=S0G7I8_9BACT|nr:alpha/beta hydrolase [Desulfotignum phosphitoxidans]EMS80946.1 alpha/beta hydrolase fold protein [Desulfotignum phosphitoxidans DSM 13687]